jgi:zinc transport system substrate-binding protein
MYVLAQRMRNLGALAAFILVAPALAGCASSPNASSRSPDVVVSFYPLAYMTQRIVGDKLSVGTVIPADAEPHDYELKPSDQSALDHAKLIIFAGPGLELFLDKAEQNANAAHVPFVVASEGIELQNSSSSDEPGFDPHVWVDPVTAAREAQNIEAKLEQIDPANGVSYKANLASFLADLRGIDGAYRAGLAHCAQSKIITTHAAFGYLARSYNFTQYAISGLAPDAEPSAAKVKETVDLAKRENITTIFFESLVSPAVAQAIAAELPNGKTAVLDPIEGIPDQDVAHGATYLTIMLENLDQLRNAMGCA